MLIAITGTPGTGKSTVAPEVADLLDYDLLDLNDFIHDNNLDEAYDEERESSIVDTDQLNDALKDELADDTVIDGHLAHNLDQVDLVVVLRTEPQELRHRLENKDWDQDKIDENVEAEQLDVILQEAANQHPESTVEVETTDRDPETVAEEIQYLAQHPEERAMYTPGGTDWTDGFAP